MTTKDKNYQELKKFCLNLGADLFGVADISKIKEEFNLSKEIIGNLDRAICLGVRLSQKILDDIKDAPTKLYFHHYKTANFFLDQLAFRVANWIQKKGVLSLPIAASQIVNWEKQTAHLSHKKILPLHKPDLIIKKRLKLHSINTTYSSSPIYP